MVFDNAFHSYFRTCFGDSFNCNSSAHLSERFRIVDVDMMGFCCSLVVDDRSSELSRTFCADIAVFVALQVVHAAAEYAIRFILFQNDSIAFGKDLERISLFDIHDPTKLDRENQSSKFVDASYCAC